MPHAHIHSQEVLAQLGGQRFALLTGAKCVAVTDNAVHFELPENLAPSGINRVVIMLDADASYSMECWHCDGLRTKALFVDKGLHGYDLQLIFTKHTGLATDL